LSDNYSFFKERFEMEGKFRDITDTLRLNTDFCNSKQKVVISWSGGKDSALTLYSLQQDENYEVAGLLTTILENEKK
jgi:tRNA(Ile)-lysidine synthase TilS/MesJ